MHAFLIYYIAAGSAQPTSAEVSETMLHTISGLPVGLAGNANQCQQNPYPSGAVDALLGVAEGIAWCLNIAKRSATMLRASSDRHRHRCNRLTLCRNCRRSKEVQHHRAERSEGLYGPRNGESNTHFTHGSSPVPQASRCRHGWRGRVRGAEVPGRGGE